MDGNMVLFYGTSVKLHHCCGPGQGKMQLAVRVTRHHDTSNQTRPADGTLTIMLDTGDF